MPALGKKQDPIWKITKAKRAGGITQGWAPAKCEVLSSNPSISPPKKKKKGREGGKSRPKNNNNNPTEIDKCIQ
jgi:hypothetical protein